MKKKFSGIIVLLALLSPRLASAHSPIQGMSDFYNGLLHPFFSLPHLLVVIPLGILMGRQAEKRGTSLSLGFLLALVVGLGCATFSIGFAAEKTLLVGAAALGLLLAVGRPLPAFICWSAALAMGLVMGLDFASEIVKSKGALNFGTGLTLYFICLYAMLLSENFTKQKWQQIGVRVLGSWIAACALLALSLSVFLKKP